ncbi:axonemal dynein light chain domain-containing protein 1 [Nematolebias whitei]|uniref:axonemal dynein light chain domain-containing protein 1 n=1 Tax=Nematolebias whitei TaxID=451745 RepID=UPI001899CD2A|nr:axonemal dynein light chain domain-containing protein 1 [Nematolebias whitei]
MSKSSRARSVESSPERSADTTDLRIEVQAEGENSQLLPVKDKKIPDELLVSLASTVCNKNSKGHTAHLQHCQDFEIRRPDAVWHHPRGRNKYKYFLEQPTSLTGAGRDISFICDAVFTQKRAAPLPPVMQSSHPLQNQNLTVSENVIPEEYRIVRNKGLRCLELYEDAFTVQLRDQNQRLRVLPSLRPSGRLEVIQLMRMMNDMLEKAGVDQQNEELTEHCQLEGLLELVKVEQNIYNIVFHEVIRQVAVGCAERGQLLANLRERYQSLLDRIPRRLKALHTEAVAQRALDRRLTEEIVRIKASIQQLNMELSKIRDHDVSVSQQVEHSHQKLAAALKEPYSNLDVAQGYHELYELHRARQDAQLLQMTEERDLWKQFTLDLSRKVIEVKKLHLVRQLLVNETGWLETSKHCLCYLSSKDAEDLYVIMKSTDYWKEQFVDLVSQLEIEHAQFTPIIDMLQNVAKWFSHLIEQNKCPDSKFDKTSVEGILSDLKQLSKMLTIHYEKYQGEHQRLCQQKLGELGQDLERWLRMSHRLFDRHPTPDFEATDGHRTLRELDQVLSELVKQLDSQVSGESGFFRILMALVSKMDSWISKTVAVTIQNERMSVSDWLHMEELLHECQSWTAEASLHFSISVQTKKVFDDIQGFTNNLSNFTVGENKKLQEEVTSVRKAQTLWMLNLLLVVVPDHSEEQNHVQEPDNRMKISLQTLNQEAKMLSCNLILEEMMIVDPDQHLECEKEMNACKNLQRECENWVETWKMLLTGHGDIWDLPVNQPASLHPFINTDSADTVKDQVSEEALVELTPDKVRDARDEAEADPRERSYKGAVTLYETPVVNTIGFDGSITQKRLGESRVHLPGTDELVLSQVTEEDQRAFRELSTVIILQQQLIDSDLRAKTAEQRALKAEEALLEALDKFQI